MASVLIVFVVAHRLQRRDAAAMTARPRRRSAPRLGAVPEAKSRGARSRRLAERDRGLRGRDRSLARPAASRGDARRGPGGAQEASITLSAKPNEVEGVADKAIRDRRRARRLRRDLRRHPRLEQRERLAHAEDPVGRPGQGPRADLQARARLLAFAAGAGRDRPARALESLVRDARADREGLRTRLAKATTDKERSRLRGLLDRASRRVTSAPATSTSSAPRSPTRRSSSRSRATAAPARSPTRTTAGPPVTRSATPAACSRSSPAWR